MTDDVLDELVGLAVTGDREATGRLLAIIRPTVVRYCRARLGTSSMAAVDDVAQEVCIAVWKAMPRYRHQGRPFIAFVLAIAANKVKDAQRAGLRTKSTPVSELPDVADADADPEQRALDAEVSGQIGRLLHRLPARQRELLVLRVVLGLSAEETAEATGSTPGAVRVAQHRALARLRTFLRETQAAPQLVC